ncbi:hypothetical protein Poli38472_002897 [Pythium oligandrum]|uniref:Kinesin motor domain-containing protein n=1 Tax=Pythium oligandrum TaxID=41045 RepID=A0A8K1FET4_PYTOL|nr:hypothetical protein Poli38472_002897 [Pythium oligandrum]|eukprot:TMW56972.1 hypothetical protein Poli38472_002897 [Pythium oligandrum]
MERAHVLVRLRDAGEAYEAGVGSSAASQGVDGVCRTSATTVRLEHSDMSPGVASISFEQVFDTQHSNADVFQQSLVDRVNRVLEGHAMTLVATGAAQSGKSFALHGDEQYAIPGLMQLTIEHVFRQLEMQRDDGMEVFQVLLACVSTAQGRLIDAFAASPSAYEDTDSELLSYAVLVKSSAEALSVYHQAREIWKEPEHAASDVVCALFVEKMGGKNKCGHRGRFLCIDIHGSSIIEPTIAANVFDTVPSHIKSAPSTPTKTALFADTHFPINKTLARYFGAYLGNSSSTYLLVTILKPAAYQQQAIQALLYACKAKDIRNTSPVKIIEEITSARSSSSLPRRPRIESVDKDIASIPPSSPVSSTSSESSGGREKHRTFPSRNQTDNPREQSPSISEKTRSQRLRDAYAIAKAATSVQVTSEDNQTPTRQHRNVLRATDSMQQLHATADALLNGSVQQDLTTMSLLDKLGLIQTQFQELEKSVEHESSVKKKCVERISKLSQTMSFQMVEHEKQIKSLEDDKRDLQKRLIEMQGKYDSADETLTMLQKEVENLKLRTQVPVIDTELASNSPTKQNERVLLQQFSIRLEAAMQEAKSVVDHKDRVIFDLEAQLQQIRRANEDLETYFLTEKARLEGEKDQVVKELRKCESELTQEKERVSLLQKEHAKDQATWSSELSEVRAELKRTSQKLAEQDRGSSTQVDQITNELQQVREQLEEATRKSVAMEAALASTDHREREVERELETLQVMAAKDKKKLEKKIKALLIDRKQQKGETSTQLLAAQEEESQLRQELERVKQELQVAVVRATGAEGTLKRLAEAAEENARLKREVETLLRRIDSIESEKDVLRERSSCSEQSLARQLVEREVHITAEYERRMREMMERHSNEVLERDLELRHAHEQIERLQAQRNAAPLNVSSSSSASYSKLEPAQRSLDKLDAILDGSGSGHKSKSKSLRRLEKRCVKQEDKITALERKIEELTHALAIANEQETLAKEAMEDEERRKLRREDDQDALLRQVNQLKQENWTLSLALQVTERQKVGTNPLIV